MAAKKRAAKKRTGRKKAAAKRRSKRRVARKRATVRRKRTTRPAATRAARRKRAAKKSAGKKKAAGKKAAKKKGAKKKGAKKKGTKKKPGKTTTVAAVAHTIIIRSGRAWPGSLPVRRGDTITWDNRDATSYILRFADSPFLTGHRGEDIPLAGNSPSGPHTVERTKDKDDYHYDIINSTATGIPPGEPEVTVGD